MVFVIFWKGKTYKCTGTTCVFVLCSLNRIFGGKMGHCENATRCDSVLPLERNLVPTNVFPNARSSITGRDSKVVFVLQELGFLFFRLGILSRVLPSRGAPSLPPSLPLAPSPPPAFCPCDFQRTTRRGETAIVALLSGRIFPRSFQRSYVSFFCGTRHASLTATTRKTPRKPPQGGYRL